MHGVVFIYDLLFEVDKLCDGFKLCGYKVNLFLTESPHNLFV